jgi:hypothetical protein
MFKAKRIYVKLRRDHVEITNLENGETVFESAQPGFSSERNVVAEFYHAENAIRNAIEKLAFKKVLFFGPSFIVLIQQLEGTEGGLSNIEMRALRDLAEQVGGQKVFIVESSKPLNVNEALEYLDRQQ